MLCNGVGEHAAPRREARRVRRGHQGRRCVPLSQLTPSSRPFALSPSCSRPPCPSPCQHASTPARPLVLVLPARALVLSSARPHVLSSARQHVHTSSRPLALSPARPHIRASSRSPVLVFRLCADTPTYLVCTRARGAAQAWSSRSNPTGRSKARRPRRFASPTAASSPSVRAPAST